MKLKIFVLLVLLLVLLLILQLGHAQIPTWFHGAIKVDNPNQLLYWAGADKVCPVTEGAMQEIIEGVFIRSRVKPVKEAIFDPGSIYLDVSLSCLKREENWYVYHIGVWFSRYSPTPAVKFDHNFGTTGIGADTNITAAIKETVEAAITEYIKANFDL